MGYRAGHRDGVIGLGIGRRDVGLGIGVDIGAAVGSDGCRGEGI